MIKPHYSSLQTAKILGVSQRTILRWCKSGKMFKPQEIAKVGYLWKIKLSGIQRVRKEFYGSLETIKDNESI